MNTSISNININIEHCDLELNLGVYFWLSINRVPTHTHKRDDISKSE